MKKTIKILGAGAFALVLGAGIAWAGDYPDRPIGVAVSYGAGGATDFQARIVTMVAGNKDIIRQPMYIINKPGAGGRVGWNWFATEAEKDGYMLSAYNIPHFIAQSIKGGVSYSADSFEPIANWGEDPAVVIVGKDSKFNTIGDLIEFAKANPGKVTTSGVGLFVGHHIAALQIQKACACKIAYIPTKGGGAAAMKAVIAGDVMAGINNLSDAYRASKAGNIKVLGVADVKRNTEFLPDVQMLKEAGLDVDNSSVKYRGLMVPKGTPPEIIDKLAAIVPEMFKHKRVSGKMAAGGSPMNIMTRADVQKMWADRQTTLAELLKGL
jgi:tripartite-type tricarboxylate transporter receptor subunit TctC